MESDFGIMGFKHFFVNVVAAEIAKHYYDEESDNFDESVARLIQEVFSRPSYLPFCRVMDAINAECADFTADIDSPDFGETFEDLICQVMMSGGRDNVFLDGDQELFMWASFEVQRLLVEAYMLLSDMEEDDEDKLSYQDLLSFPKYTGKPYIDG